MLSVFLHAFSVLLCIRLSRHVIAVFSLLFILENVKRPVCFCLLNFIII
jgi:hypothetical protein